MQSYSPATFHRQIGALVQAAFQFPVGMQRDQALQSIVLQAHQWGVSREDVEQQVLAYLEHEKSVNLPSLNAGQRMLNQVVEILGKFGVPLESIEAIEGPRVWVLRLKPDDRKGMVKVSKIEQHLDDLASRVTGFVNPIIEYKSPIEIQVQKQHWQPCHLIDYVSPETIEPDDPFRLTLGVRVDRSLKVPEVEHIQIAGAPGSGKTALQNAMIGDLMVRYPPWLCQWVFIDIEKVGLKAFNGLHWFWRGVDRSLPDRALIDAKDGYFALEQLLLEHNRRLDLFDDANVDDLRRYNRKNRQQPLPHLICLIDEAWAFRHHAGQSLFPDMENLEAQVKAGETAIDHKLIEIAQRCRKSGIHLIVSTQRASQDVLNPLLRASLSTKVALKASDEGSSAVAFGYKCDWAVKLGRRGDFWLVHDDGVERLQALYIDRDEAVGQNGETRLDELIQGGYFKYRRWRQEDDRYWSTHSVPPVSRHLPNVTAQNDPEPEEDDRDQYFHYRTLAAQGKDQRQILIELFGHRHSKPETAAAGNSRKRYLEKIEEWKQRFEDDYQD